MSDSQADWVRRVLGFDIASSAGAHADLADPGPFGKLRLAWLDAQKAVAAELDRLRNAALADFADDPLSANLARLDEVLAGFAEGLEDRLDQITKAKTAAARGIALGATRMVAQRYFNHVLNDTLIDHIETNPFAPVIISGRLLTPLSDILQAVAEAGGR